MTRQRRRAALTLCDRGTIDGAAYWPGTPESYFAAVGTTLEAELARYTAVIHLVTPSARDYERRGVRIETAEEALAVDERIRASWARHPRRHVIPANASFVAKIDAALRLALAELPPCCARPT